MTPTNMYPVADNHLTGSLSALMGGTTTIVNTIPLEASTSLLGAFQSWMAKASDKVTGLRCDYSVCSTLPYFSSLVAEEMRSLVTDHGVTFFLLDNCTQSLDNSKPRLNDSVLLEALSVCSDLGALACVTASVSKLVSDRLSLDLKNKYPSISHEGHILSRPERGESDTISRATLLAGEAICPLLIRRLNSKHALSTFSALRCRGETSSGLLFGITTAPALSIQIQDKDSKVLSFSPDWNCAAGHVCEPPIRIDPEVSHSLAAHLAAGDILAVGSAHLAFSSIVKASLGQKDFRRLPEGIAAIGARLAVVWQTCVHIAGILDPCSFVAAVSSNPARLANLYPRKGLVAPGSDADLIIWDPAYDREHKFTKSLLPEGVFDVFSSLSCHGRPRDVILRGQLVVEDYKLLESIPLGVYLKTKPFSSLLYSRLPLFKSYVNSSLKAVNRENYDVSVVNPDLVNRTSESLNQAQFYRKADLDNVPKEALPPGKRQIHTSVKTHQPPGGAAVGSLW